MHFQQISPTFNAFSAENSKEIGIFACNWGFFGAKAQFQAQMPLKRVVRWSFVLLVWFYGKLCNNFPEKPQNAQKTVYQRTNVAYSASKDAYFAQNPGPNLVKTHA